MAEKQYRCLNQLAHGQDTWAPDTMVTEKMVGGEENLRDLLSRGLITDKPKPKAAAPKREG